MADGALDPIALYGTTLWAEVELLATVERGIADGTLRGDIGAATLARLIEAAAIAVLDEATCTGMSDDEGRRLVILNGLGAAGIGWREAEELVHMPLTASTS